MSGDRLQHHEPHREAHAAGRRVVVVQHQADCPPALFADWLAEAGVVLDVLRPDRGDPVPTGLADEAGVAGLIVLGGAMGAHDDAAHPWLTPTKDLLRHAIGAGLPTLGVCLGHQLAAVALGGTSRRGTQGRNIGVRPVGWRETAVGDRMFGGLAADGDALVPHWNIDVVTGLPDGVTVLAVTDDGAPQVVRFGPHAWGVQFHPEVDHAVVVPWADEDRVSAAAEGVDVDEMLREVKEAEAGLHATGRGIAHSFARIVLDTR